VKTTFTSKSSKTGYAEGNAKHALSLSSLLLETETTVYHGSTDDVLRNNPPHRNQFPYRAVNSTSTTLHSVTTHTENAVKHTEKL
jgi:hypothetical protein